MHLLSAFIFSVVMLLLSRQLVAAVSAFSGRAMYRFVVTASILPAIVVLGTLAVLALRAVGLG